MINVDLKSRAPIYEQIYEGMKNLILKEILEENQKIPSVRELSAQLTINPNTIQKAYRQLEQDGYIYVVRGRGNFVNNVGESLKAQEIKVIKKRMNSIVKDAKLLGLDEASIKAMVAEAFKEESDD